MKIIVSGSSGLVGSELVPTLEAAGHDVVRLVRGSAGAARGEALWDPAAGVLDPTAIDGADAIVNLNGRSIADGRWNAAVKNELRSSRIASTKTLVEAIRASSRPPRVLVNASAVGYYGDRDEEVLDESSAPGEGFLAGLSRDWEDAAVAAASDPTRVALLRLGVVVAKEGAVGKMLTPFKLGVGGPIGSGRQFWPWIGIEDVCEIVKFIIGNESVKGPVNAVAPQETRCAEFARTLGRVLSRPAIMPMPAFAARLALGEMADALLLSSQRVRPKVLQEHGYVFRHPNLEEALAAAISG